MKPLIHAKVSVKRHGGCVEDYLPIHEFIDSSKIAMPDVRHRAILHSSFGCYMAERIFGTYITNAQGKDVSVRDLAEEHIQEDLGFIPEVSDWLGKIELQPWMSGGAKKRREERLVD